MTATRILRNTGANVEVTFLADSVATDPDANVATVGITKADESVLVAAGTAATRVSQGRYKYALAPQADLNHLTLSWTAMFSGVSQTLVTHVELVGGFYLATSDLRSVADLDDVDQYPEAKLVKGRRWFEDRFEKATSVAWVPRYRRARLSGDGTSELTLPDLYPRRVLSVRVYSDAATYVAFSPAEIADLVVDDHGELRRSSLGSFAAGLNNIVVEYEHGWTAPTSDVVEAGEVAIRDHLMSATQGNRVYAVQTQDGIVRSSVPGRDRPFGIPEVDAVVSDRSHKVPGIA